MHKTKTGSALATIAALAMSLLIHVATPSVAHADLATFWLSPKGTSFGGSGDVFRNFDNDYGAGLEAGIELFGVDLYGEAIAMGFDQFLLTANLGLDARFGEDISLTLGVFTGPIFFIFPKSEEVNAIDFSVLSAEEQAALEAATGVTVAEAQEEFNTFAEQEQDLARLAVGYNVAKARADIDAKLAPGLYLGVTGQVGYHFLLSGEDIAAGAKNEALNKFARDNDLPDDVKEAIREALGAKPVDEDQLDGINYEVHLHLRLEFGL